MPSADDPTADDPTADPRRDPRAPAAARFGPNTGFQDALGVLVRLLQRGSLTREEVEEVVRENCQRSGRPAPSGSSMQRRLERLRATFEESGLVIEPLLAVGTDPAWRCSGLRLEARRPCSCTR